MVLIMSDDTERKEKEKGKEGPQGPQGVQGVQGIQGIQGSQGVQGIQGSDASSLMRDMINRQMEAIERLTKIEDSVIMESNLLEQRAPSLEHWNIASTPAFRSLFFTHPISFSEATLQRLPFSVTVGFTRRVNMY